MRPHPIGVAALLVAASLSPMNAVASDVALVATLEGVGISAHGEGRELDVDEDRRPGPLKDTKLTLDGSGSMLGVEARYVFLVPSYGIRIGIGSGFFGAEGIVVKNQGLPAGFDLKTTSTFAVVLELSLGREFDAGPVIPYLDARGSFEQFTAQIQLRSQDFGFVGKTPFGSGSFGLGPRVGMLVPLGEQVFIDLSGTYQLLGPFRVSAGAGLGVLLGDRDEPTPPPSAARRLGRAAPP